MLIFDYPVHLFHNIFEMTNEKTIHKEARLTSKGNHKFLHGLSPPIMNNIFKVIVSINNLKNFQLLYSTCMKTVRFETETVT